MSTWVAAVRPLLPAARPPAAAVQVVSSHGAARRCAIVWTANICWPGLLNCLVVQQFYRPICYFPSNSLKVSCSLSQWHLDQEYLENMLVLRNFCTVVCLFLLCNQGLHERTMCSCKFYLNLPVKLLVHTVLKWFQRTFNCRHVS